MAGLIPQVLVDGFLQGLMWALAATGMSLLFSVMGIVNFTHGAVYMLGAIIIYFLMAQAGLNYFASFIISVAIVAAMGPLFERIFFRPVQKNMLSVVIMGLAVTMVVEQTVLIFFGTAPQGVQLPYSVPLKLPGVSVSLERIVTGVIAALLIGLLFLFLYRTKMGLLVRAVTQDKGAAAIMGIQWSKVGAISFAIAFALAASAGALYAPFSAIDAFMGGSLLLKVFIIVIVGGMGSLLGGVVVAVGLGMVESVLVVLIGYPAYLLGFILVFIVLLVRPQGLFHPGR